MEELEDEEECPLLPETSETGPEVPDAEGGPAGPKGEKEAAEEEEPASTTKKVKNKTGNADGDDGSKKVSVLKLFLSNSKSKEILLMLLGTASAFLNGNAFPSLSVAFGSMSDSIMDHTLHGPSNVTFAPIIVNHTEGNYHIQRVLVENIETTPNLDDVDVKTGYFEKLLKPKIVSSEFESPEAKAQSEKAQAFNDSASSFSIYSVLIGILALVSSVIQSVAFQKSSSGQNERRKQGFYRNIFYQDQAWYDKNNRDQLAKQFSGHLDNIQHGTGTQFSEIIKKITGFGSGVGVAISKSWPFTLILMTIVPILALKSAFNSKFEDQSRRKRDEYRKGGAHTLQVFSAIRTVAAFGGEYKEIEKYKSEVKEDVQDELRYYYRLAGGFALTNFLTYAAYALAFWAATHVMASGTISAGTIYTILLALMLGASNLGNAVHNIQNVVQAKSSANAVNEVIVGGEQIEKRATEGHVLERIEGYIIFDNVSFNFPIQEQQRQQNNFTLRNIYIDIEPQQIVALVGPKDSGKATLAKLLEGFYDVTEGVITIDGHPISTLNIPEFRKRLGIIPEIPFLISGTVRENICCGNLDASDDDIMEAAANAFAHDFISALPNGYDTVIEDDEDDNPPYLTREQKHLIVIARTLLRNPDVVILEKPLINEQIYPTSAQALGNVCSGKTTIIISDRMADVQFANLIYVFSEGTMVEYGSYEELLSSDGLYAALLAEEILMDSIEELSTVEDLEAEEQEETEDDVHEVQVKNAQSKLEQKVTRDEMEDEVANLNLTLPTPLEILKLNMNEKFSVAIAISSSVVVGLVLPTYAVLYAEFFNTFTKTGTELWESAKFNTLMFVVLAIISALANGMQVAFAAIAAENLSMRLKINAFVGIIRQSISWFEEGEHSAEKLSKRLAIDTELVREAGINLICNAINVSTTILASSIVILYTSWQIGIVVLLLAYPFLLYTNYSQTAHKHDKLHVERTHGKVSSSKIMAKCIANIKSIQELGLQDYFYDKYKKAKQAESEQIDLKTQILESSKVGFAQSGVFFIYSGVFGGGSSLISLGIVDAVGLYRIFFSTIFCASGIGALIASVVDHKKGQLAAALVLNLAEMKSEIDPFKMTGKAPRFAGELVVSDVHFHYASEETQIEALSFKAEKRRILAIGGPPTSGKSTIFALYERFYDVAKGRMLIDGYDVRDLKLQHLRANLGYVTKNPFFFDGTIRDNLVYGIGGPSEIIPEEKIISAAKSAMIHEFISGLPQRYDTLIGPKGLELSIRQKQRLAFARAVIRNPVVLLIDEPKIYNESEESRKLAEDALDNVCEGRTCIILARSQYILQHSDCVAFMSGGKIIEMGSPSTILAAKGIDYKLKQRD